MNSRIFKLNEYLLNHKELIRNLSRQNILIFLFAICVSIFSIWFISNFTNKNPYFLLIPIVSNMYFEGFFKKCFADKYELKKYKTPFDYLIDFYVPKKIRTISRFKKFNGGRQMNIFLIGICILIIITFTKGTVTDSLFYSIGACTVMIATVDKFRNIINEIKISRKFEKLFNSGLSEIDIAESIVDFQSNPISSEQYQELVTNYNKDCIDLEEKFYVKPVIPKEHKKKN